jgi:hypothetical protein
MQITWRKGKKLDDIYLGKQKGRKCFGSLFINGRIIFCLEEMGREDVSWTVLA